MRCVRPTVRSVYLCMLNGDLTINVQIWIVRAGSCPTSDSLALFPAPTPSSLGMNIGTGRPVDIIHCSSSSLQKIKRFISAR